MTSPIEGCRSSQQTRTSRASAGPGPPARRGCEPLPAGEVCHRFWHQSLIRAVCSLTCRRRRIKCDEGKPICAQCVKSDKTCDYDSSAPTQDGVLSSESSVPQQRASSAGSSSASFSFPASRTATAGHVDSQFLANSPELRLDLSPLTLTASLPSPNSAPFEWYDLLAEDAINNIQRHNLGFDETCLPRRQSPAPETPRVDPGPTDIHLKVPGQGPAAQPSASTPWNTSEIISLNDDELGLFQHYINVVGPILDLFDPCRHFATVIPRLASEWPVLID